MTETLNDIKQVIKIHGLRPQWMWKKSNGPISFHKNFKNKKSPKLTQEELRNHRIKIYDSLDERFEPIFSYQDYCQFLTDPKYTLEKHTVTKKKEEKEYHTKKSIKELKEIFIYHKDGSKTLFSKYYPITEEELQIEENEYEETIEYYEYDCDNTLIEDDDWNDILGDSEQKDDFEYA